MWYNFAMTKLTMLLAATAAAGFAAAKQLPANGEFQCEVNFGFYAREGYYESSASPRRMSCAATIRRSDVT
jgi:hypothetical protein